jgi:hypothetical protein
MRTSQLEQIKLFAGYLNTIGAGMIVTGIVAPVAALMINPGLSHGSIIYFALASFGLSLSLRGFAQATLGRLPDDA